MTREEAIRILKVSIENSRNHVRFCFDNKGITALDMAIKALEQEPCEDAISREAVEEIINDIRSCISVEGYWAILERLKKLPSVKPQERTGYCEDCKHFRKLPLRTDTIGKCVQHWGVCPPCDWFCADFEPQERSE